MTSFPRLDYDRRFKCKLFFTITMNLININIDNDIKYQDKFTLLI